MILLLVLSAGFVYRIAFLGHRQLWTDEIIQAVITRAASFPDLMIRLRDAQFAPAPLDYLAQKAFIFILGEAPWTLRLHAALFGTVALFFFYRIARTLFGERAALYATFLFAFYPLHHHYSQEGRPYALLVLMTLICYERLLDLVRRPKLHPAGLATLGVALLLTVYSSFLGLLVICSQFLALVLSALTRRDPAEANPSLPGSPWELPPLPPARWSLVLSYGAVAAAACALFLPWVAFAWKAPGGVAEEANMKLVLRIFKELGDSSYPMSALIFLGVTLGTLALRRIHGRQALLWLWTWFLTTIPVLLLIVMSTGYFLAVRHILYATPPLILLAGFGIARVSADFSTFVPGPRKLYAVLFLTGSLFSAVSRWRHDPVDWIGAAGYLNETVSPGQSILMPQIYQLIEYYHPRLAQQRAPWPQQDGPLSLEGVSYVVCLDHLSPNPCDTPGNSLRLESGWRMKAFKGMRVYERSERTGSR